MKLYVCWSTRGGRRHACAVAHDALRQAGHDVEVVRSYGSRLLPEVPFNTSAGRRRAKHLTGSSRLPVLELDDGRAIAGSDAIAAWARSHAA